MDQDRHPAAVAAHVHDPAKDLSTSLLLVSHTPELPLPRSLRSQSPSGHSAPGHDSDASSASWKSPSERELSRSPEFELPPRGVDSSGVSWGSWVQNYASGRWAGDKEPPLPPAISAILEESAAASSSSSDSPLSETHLFPTSSTAPSRSRSPAALLDFYQQHGHFPAPDGTFEEARLRTVRRYGLDQPKRRAAIDRVCRIAKNHYQTSTVIISLVFEGHQVLAAESGWAETDPGVDAAPRHLSLDQSLCRHGITRTDPSSTFIVPDASLDWRFKNNPYTLANGGVLSFYASSNIFLPTAESSTSGETPATIPVGSICVIDNRPRPSESFTSTDRQVLNDLADLVAREFQLGFSQHRLATEAAQTAFLGSFLSSSLVYPGAVDAPRTNLAPATEALAGQARRDANDFGDAAGRLRELTGAGSAVVLDLRAWKGARGRMFVLGSEGDVEWEEVVGRCGGTVVEALEAFERTGEVVFGGLEESAFMNLIEGTEAACVVPIFDVDKAPALLLVLTSSERHFRFEDADRKFVQNVGAVVIGALLRQRALEADRAKLAFVSQISHELRTPLHGINSQVELIREFSSPSQLVKLGPLLDVADVCLDSLRDVLEDVLDFSKLSHFPSPEASRSPKRTTEADLEQVIEDVAKTSWVRKRRVDLVAMDGTSMPQGKVDIILEVEERSEGWKVLMDVGKIKRVLLNVVGNAIKFTPSGHVKISLREQVVPVTARTPGKRMVAIDVEDTGCGMSDEFLRDGKLFTPFVQENPFANGAGLGMSICETIIRHLNGRLEATSIQGQGSTFTILLPLAFLSLPDLASPSDSRVPPSFHRRIISEELINLCDTTAAQLSVTPTREKDGYDFSKAAEAQNGEMRLESIPAGKRKVDDGLVDGVAKLGIGTAVAKVSLTPCPEKESIAPLVNILFADDNLVGRNILAKLLSGKGVAFAATEDGQQAVDAFKAGSFNCLLLDVQMPHKDGIEAAFEIREYEKERGLPRSRIIALTGLSNEADMEKAGVLSGDGPIDSWLVKGGKSLRVILQEIANVEAHLRSLLLAG